VETYLGRYQIEQGPVLEVAMAGKRLVARQGGNTMELVPETETSFYVPAVDLWFSVVRDDAGKVSGLTGYQNGALEATKLE
jgi:hypothetical protein